MMDRIIRWFGFGLMLIAMTMFVSACGGSGSGGLGDLGVDTNNNLSEEQALAFAKSVTRVSTSSLSAPPLKADTVPGEISPLRATTCNTSTGCQVNEQIAYTLNCTSGGNMKASGNITGHIDNNGSGSLHMDVPITIWDWKCEPPSIINGDPLISITGTFSYLNGAPSTQQHIQISGGFKSSDWTCQINLGTDFNTSGGGHSSGTICGYFVDFTF